MHDISRLVPEGQESLCCLCDNPVIFADYAVVIANGAYVMVHRHCLDDLDEKQSDD